MPLPWKDIETRALAFSKQWKEATDEFADAQSFLNEFFNVFGIDRKRVGTFEVRQCKARDGRNPSTGKTIKITAQKVPTFKAGKALKDQVQ